VTQRQDVDRRALAKDVLVFQGKLALDGLKDICVFWATLGAGLIDLALARTVRTRLFYRVVQASHRLDGTLDLHGAYRKVFGG
jgi:hypothetical protein